MLNNVVKLKNESTEIFDQINKYLRNHSYNSEQTKKSYETDIRQFFSIIKGKEINNLTYEDIQLTLDDFEEFISILYSEKDNEGKRIYSNKTINRKVAAVKGLVRYLAAKKIINDASFLDLIKSLPEKSNRRGFLTAEEVFQIAEYALVHEREKREIKYYAFLFALDTCIRKSALLDLKWSDFIVRNTDVIVSGVDKGNKEFKENISKEFYNQLLSIKDENSPYVFNISKKSLEQSFIRACDGLGIKRKERNITFHSIRKAGITFRYRYTGDILEAQRAAKHSRLDTTRIYLENEDYGAVGAVSSKGKIDANLYKKVDLNTLVKAIDELPKDSRLILNIKLNEILNKR